MRTARHFVVRKSKLETENTFLEQSIASGQALNPNQLLPLPGNALPGPGSTPASSSQPSRYHFQFDFTLECYGTHEVCEVICISLQHCIAPAMD